jgi:hypothetical protein
LANRIPDAIKLIDGLLMKRAEQEGAAVQVGFFRRAELRSRARRSTKRGVRDKEGGARSEEEGKALLWRRYEGA